MTIQEMIEQHIQQYGTAAAVVATVDDIEGVIFMDEGEFIPFYDLGYNRELGFYRLSLFPDVQNEAGRPAWSVRRIIMPDEEGQEQEPIYALFNPAGNGYVLGSEGMIKDFLPVLQAFVEKGEQGKPVAANEVRW